MLLPVYTCLKIHAYHVYEFLYVCVDILVVYVDSVMKIPIQANCCSVRHEFSVMSIGADAMGQPHWFWQAVQLWNRTWGETLQYNRGSRRLKNLVAIFKDIADQCCL